MTSENQFPTTDADVAPDDVDSVYRQLEKGVGREYVTEQNVDALIQRAERNRHTVLATELREWKSAC